MVQIAGLAGPHDMPLECTSPGYDDTPCDWFTVVRQTGPHLGHRTQLEPMAEDVTQCPLVGGPRNNDDPWRNCVSHPLQGFLSGGRYWD